MKVYPVELCYEKIQDEYNVRVTSFKYQDKIKIDLPNDSTIVDSFLHLWCDTKGRFYCEKDSGREYITEKSISDGMVTK